MLEEGKAKGFPLWGKITTDLIIGSLLPVSRGSLAPPAKRQSWPSLCLTPTWLLPQPGRRAGLEWPAFRDRRQLPGRWLDGSLG